jgi:hypothetical protein
MIQDGCDGTILWEVNPHGIIVTGRPVMLHTACGRPFAAEEEHAGRQQWQCEPLSIFAERLAATLHVERALTYSSPPVDSADRD